MHGVINRAIQTFLHRTYGVDLHKVLDRAPDGTLAGSSAAGPAGGVPGHEVAMPADGQATAHLLAAAERALGKSRARILEDLGTWLVASGGHDIVRRLLRFGGVDFVEFLHSLDELPERARLALEADLLPPIEVRESAPDRFAVVLHGGGFGALMLGLLRAMADDYGALAVIELTVSRPECEEISVRVFKADYAAGRAFVLCPG